MNLNWLQSLLFGLLSGLADILPVSAQAHKAILLTVFGADGESPLMRLMIHLAVLASLYYSCRSQIRRMIRQRRLARVPKRRRKRPVDVRTLLDFRLLATMLIPLALAFFLYPKTSAMNLSLNWIALFLVLNGIILYLLRQQGCQIPFPAGGCTYGPVRRTVRFSGNFIRRHDNLCREHFRCGTELHCESVPDGADGCDRNFDRV